MPRGVPTNGVRAKRRTRAEMDGVIVKKPVAIESDVEIAQKLNDRFEILQELSEATVRGDVRALIVSGPAGLGKSYTVEQAVQAYDPDGIRSSHIKGYVRATGLFKLLYQHRLKGQVIVFDDADAIFFDDTALNILKAACDSSKSRTISWMSEAKFEDEEGDKIPSRFTFEGTILFITNYDFDEMIERGHRLAPHLQALISRAHYIDLAMKTKRDYYIRIHQVIKLGLLSMNGYNKAEETDVVRFLDENFDRLRETSLRIVLKIADLRRSNPARFEKMARVTCCRTFA